MTEANKPLDQMTAQERLVLGRSYFKEGKFDEAIKALSSIRQEEADPETYAWAQYSLGVVYREQGNLDEAIIAWSKIRHDDDLKVYILAQLSLGVVYIEQGNLDEAITAWSKIRREEIDSETYALTQISLGEAYKVSNKPDEAITVLSKIRREEIDSETYARAQFYLGEIHKGKGEIKQAKDAYRNVQGPFYYRAQREYRILDCPPELINDLHNLAKNTDEVLKSLQIIPEFESKVAHYSRLSTAFDLFEGKKMNRSHQNSDSILFVVSMTQRKG